MDLNTLTTLIEHHDYKYWIENDPEINDIEYDNLVLLLTKLDPENPLLKIKNGVRINTKKISHNPPMLSLDKVYSPNELIKWATKVARNENEIFLLQPKFDGIAAKLDLKFNILSTSGNTGYEGENITDKTSLINFILNKEGDNRFIYGEIIFHKELFDNIKHKLLRKNGNHYKIPRSAVVGLLSNDMINTDLKKILTFVDYTQFSTELNIEYLKNINWDKYIKQMKDWSFPLDGLVLKLKDKDYFNSLGFTSHHYRGQMAMKFGNPSGITVLTNIEFQSGKESVTPVGIIETIEIDGINNSKISLHNWKYIIDNNINIGDTIEIERCGEIIPQFKKIIKKCDNPKNIEIKCPDCQSDLIYDEPHLKCSYDYCSGKVIRILTDAVVRLGIEELGIGTIKKLVFEQNVKTLNDILNLTYDDVIKLSGFANQSAMNLINQINKVKNNPIYDYNILASFNISGIGLTLSKKILKNYNLTELMNLSVDELQNVEQIGKERAFLIEEFLFVSKDSINQLLNDLNIIESKSENNITKLKICFTGSHPIKRDDWVKLAENKGFEYIKNVNKDLNLLVTDDLNSNSSKIKKAKQYNCKIITYDDFKNIVN